MPHFPIVDTHVHLWDPTYLDYPWLRGHATLHRKFLLEDFNTACDTVIVDTIVFVQCDALASQGLEEARWVTSLAKTDPRIRGTVAFAPLDQGESVRDYLEELSQIPLVKGVRRLIQSEDVGFCVQPKFIQGVQALEAFGLSFDICIRHPQMANTIQMVRQCPGISFILDHIGKPDIRNRTLEPWKREIEELARFPNVYCKVSGLVTETDMEHWTKEELRPYIDHVIECFGFDRVAYGGDWPVATLAADYPEWINALDWAVSGCSEDEKRKLFRENALRFYRL